MTSLQTSARVLHKYVGARYLVMRHSSSSQLAQTDQLNNNSLIQPAFYNRNPRNLEMMTLSAKPEGYHLDKFNVQFWHKLVVSATSAKVTAEIIHNNGSTVVSASSSEFGIRRFLYRTVDVSAFKTIGKVIAQRCLESGINSVYCDIEAEDETKLSYLLEEARQGGLSLEEPEGYKLPYIHTIGVPTKPWDIVS